VAEDEDYRIDALRQELMREIDSVRSDVDTSLGGIRTNIKLLKWLFMAVIAVFGSIATILAIAADII
jgi:hypothetical protein